VGSEERIVLARDAGEIRRLRESLPLLQAVAKARLVAACPRYIGRGIVTGTSDQKAISDAVETVWKIGMGPESGPRRPPGGGDE
jgi:hypothetical protein